MRFIEYNKKPKNRSIKDSVIRAIATNSSWEYIYSKLAEQGLMINDYNNWTEYLKSLGYEQHKMPLRDDKKTYTIEMFCNEFAEENKTYIISVLRHLTVVKDKNLYDIWDCRKSTVLSYWVI